MEPSSDFARELMAAGASNAPLHVALGAREALCPEHGAYTSTGTRYTIGKGREVWSPCLGCVEQRKTDEKEAADLARKARDLVRFEEMIGQAAIPIRFIGRGFDNFKADTDGQRRALTIARDYAESFDRHAKTGESLLFLGKAGTGKSHLAAAILQAILPGHCGMYTTAADVIEQVRSTWRRDSEISQARVLSMLATVPLLVIDEVGVQYGTESEQNTMFQILDRRYRDRKPTVLLANLEVTEFAAMVGDRIFDRLREVSRVVKFEWVSYRSTARKEAQ